MAGSREDRQLLLGMFAVHLGMCAADEVCEAVSTWNGSPDTSLAGEFDVRGLLSGRQIRLIEDLVDERLAHGGDDVWQWCSRHVSPGFIQRLRQSGGDSIRSRLEALSETVDQSAGLDPQSADTVLPGDASRESAAAAFQAAFPNRYRILRHHAQGGLGKVSVAEDIPLGREVAFKELRVDRAGDIVGRSRFLLEAKVTGRLEHPSIVPVYDVGQQPGGAPFYVMRFIHGKSLKEILKQFHAVAPADDAQPRPGVALERNVEFRGLLNRFIAVCQAVEYAHRHGVIHRDLKPANIMLGDYGETLLVDWGLAKVIGQSQPADDPTLALPGAGGHDLTMEGAALGTPAYMSPEQAAGWSDKITHATDIYGLGATLFHIVTGRAPVSGTTVTEFLEKVQHGKLEVHLSSASPGVPPALWAVCRKALATEPRDRYASAADLARDVERFLADEPVSAMQEPIFVRAKRWIRRHPTLVSTASAVSLVALISLSIGLSVVTGFSNRLKTANDNLSQLNGDLERTNGDLNEANTQLAAANLSEHDARVEAEESLRLAANSVDTFLSQVTDDPQLNRPDMSDFRATLLSSAVPYLEQMLQQAPGDAEVEFMRGKALVRLSDIHRELQQLDQSLEEVERAADVMQGVVAQDPTNTEYLFHLAVVQNNQGLALDVLGRHDEAREVFTETLATREQLLELQPGDYATRRDQARTLTNLGTIASSQGDHPTAIDFHQQALVIREALLNEAGRNAETLFELANSYTNLSIALAENRQEEEGRAAMRTAEELLREETALPEATHESWLALSYAVRNLGTHDSLYHDLNGALRHHGEAVELLRDLHERYPAAAHIRLELAKSLTDLADVRRERYEFPEGLLAFEESLQILNDLQPTYLDDGAYLNEVARCHFGGGLLLNESGQMARSDEHLAQAIERIEFLMSELPEGSHEWLALLTQTAKALDARATCLSALGEHALSEQLFLRSADLDAQLAAATGDTHRFLGEQANAFHNAAMTMLDQSRSEDAREHYARALAIREELLETSPEDEYLLSMQATTLNGVALLLRELGETDACREHYLRCIDICDRLCAVNPNHPGYPTTGAGAQNNLANLEYALGNVDAALELYDAAVNELDQVLDRLPQFPDARRFLGITLSSRASLHMEQQRYAESAADWEWGATLTDQSNVPFFKIHEAYCLAQVGEVDRAVELCASFASAAPAARFMAAETLCVSAAKTDEEAERGMHLDTAMNYLLSAEEADYFTTPAGLAQLRESIDLDVLRERVEFVELLGRVAGE